MAKQTYIWYVEPLNEQTNAVIYEYLKNRDLDTNMEPATCEDGKKHNLWECSIEAVKSLYASKEDLNLRFEIWGKQGFNGKIRKKTFLFKPSRKYLKKRKKKTAR